MTAKEMMTAAVKLLDDKKAKDISVLDVQQLTPLGDYFIICSGGSNTQVKSLAGELEKKLAELGLRPRRIEGEASAMWVLMDYSDIIIHIFYHETRDFYCLERLWSDANQVDISDIIDN